MSEDDKSDVEPSEDRPIYTDIKRLVIYEVKERLFLYDATHPDYSKRNLIQKAWEEIGQAAGISAKDAKKIWQQLRGYANTHREQLKVKLPSGSRASSKTPCRWEYADDLDFLRPHLGVTRKLGRVLSSGSFIDSLSSSNPTDIGSEVATLSRLKPECEYRSVTSSPCPSPSPSASSAESTRRKRKAASSTEQLNRAMFDYIRSQKEQLKHQPVPTYDPVTGWFQSIKPHLEKLDDISWLNFMTDCQRLLLTYMHNPPGPHYNPSTTVQFPSHPPFMSHPPTS